MRVKLSIIIASIREGRRGEKVANWFYEIAKQDSRFATELVDLADYDMPMKITFTEPSQREDKKYPNKIVQSWSDKIDNSQAVVFVMPEYNHAVSAPQKNAIDQIYYEWLEKPVGFVGYGGRGGAEDSIDSLKHTAGTLKWKVAEPSLKIIRVKQFIDKQGNLEMSPEYIEQAKQLLDSLASNFSE
jgi:NAD(P)H-dependent FMN reductase